MAEFLDVYYGPLLGITCIVLICFRIGMSVLTGKNTWGMLVLDLLAIAVLAGVSCGILSLLHVKSDKWGVEEFIYDMSVYVFAILPITIYSAVRLIKTKKRMTKEEIKNKWEEALSKFGKMWGIILIAVAIALLVGWFPFRFAMNTINHGHAWVGIVLAIITACLYFFAAKRMEHSENDMLSIGWQQVALVGKNCAFFIVICLLAQWISCWHVKSFWLGLVVFIISSTSFYYIGHVLKTCFLQVIKEGIQTIIALSHQKGEQMAIGTMSVINGVLLFMFVVMAGYMMLTACYSASKWAAILSLVAFIPTGYVVDESERNDLNVRTTDMPGNVIKYRGEKYYLSNYREWVKIK